MYIIYRERVRERQTDDLWKNARGIGNIVFFQRRKLGGYETVV